MIYTNHDISRLIPEAFIPLQMWPNNGAKFVVDETLLFSHFGPGKLLLDARRQLELAREGLGEISGLGNDSTDVGIARDTLARMEQIK